MSSHLSPLTAPHRRCRRLVDFRLADSVDSARAKQAANGGRKSPPVPKVVTQSGSQWRFFPAPGISHFRALDKYVSFEDGGKEHLTTESLKRLAARLEPWGFLQIHRAILVNMANVARIYRHASGYRVVMRCGLEMPIARRAMTRLRAKLGF